MFVISGRWLAIADWIIALNIIAVGFIGSGGCLLAALLVAGVFIWLGIRAWKSVDHW